MHLADGVYTYLLNHKRISERPLLLTYAGKQAPERNYHPNNWWRGANVVKCCISIQDSERKRLIFLDECLADFETFNKVSVSAREISCDHPCKMRNSTFTVKDIPPGLATSPHVLGNSCHFEVSDVYRTTAVTPGVRRCIPTWKICLPGS
jgi:hypothetical protein